MDEPYTVKMPTHIEAGDVLSAAVPRGMTPPPGWTLARQYGNTDEYIRVADGHEATEAFWTPPKETQ